MNVFKKKIILLPAITITLLIAFFIFWGFIKTTPQYSIYQLYKSAENHDYDRFSKYIDVDGVVNDIVDSAFDSAMEKTDDEVSESNNSFYQMGYELGQQLAQSWFMSMKPQIKEELKNDIRESVEEGTFKEDYKTASLFLAFKNLKVEKDGKVADVTIKKPESSDKLKLKMRQKDKYWEIFKMDLPIPEIDSENKEPVSEKSIEAKFGEKQDITEGWYLTVEKPELFESDDPYGQPDKGNKFFSIKVTYENTSENPGYFNVDNLNLKDTQNFSYDPIWTDERQPEIESDDLESEGSVSGYLTFEVPEESEPASVIYSGTKSIIFR